MAGAVRRDPSRPGRGAPSALAVLRAVQLRGRATPEALAAMLACARDEVHPALGALPDGAVAGTPAGLAITDAGKRWLDDQLAAERRVVDRAATGRLYADFAPVDAEVKAVITSWQLRDRGGTPVVNDHSDHAYDRRVVGELGRVHLRALPLASSAARHLERLAPFPTRLERAQRAVAAGDHRLIAAPLVDSYHTIWFELHEEVLHLAGRPRAGEAP